MAWNVNDVYNSLKFWLRQNQSGSISDSNLFYAWNTEQTTYYEDLKGRWQSRSNGKSAMNTGLIENETILTKLTPFTKPVSLTITSGNADKPSDFDFRLALRINGVDALKINHNQIANVNDSAIDPPSIADNKFFFVEYQDYYHILPHTLPTVAITTAELDYLAQPVNIKWGYTFDSQNRKVYNPGLSVQPEWMQNDIIEITKRTLTGFGVSYKDKDFQQFGKSDQMTGD